MDIKVKERLIGVMVLLSLAIIFLPSLFHRDQRVEVNTKTLIPAKPTVDPIVINRPIKTNSKPAPTPDVAFQPPLPEVKVTSKAPKAANTPKPSLNKKGLPNAWVVQLGSFQSKKRADELKQKLVSADYKAYSRPIKTSKGQFFRVFVGPYIDKSRALAVKKNVDKKYSVDSRLLTFSPE